MSGSNPMTTDAICDWLVSSCAALGLGAVQEIDDFFSVGGTSMLAIKLIARIEDAFGEDVLPPADLFIERRIDRIAQRICDALALPA